MGKLIKKGISHNVGNMVVKKKMKDIKKFVQGGTVTKKSKKHKRMKVKNPVEMNRGVVYLSHIPHGFYEEEMRKYFGQFGVVTGLNMPKNKKGRSRGYAFIEFLHPEVAKVAAETMNNYLMANRLLKAEYIPPDQQKEGLFKPRRSLLEKVKINRGKLISLQNTPLNPEEENLFYKKTRGKINSLHKKLKKLGVDYEIQVPQDSNALLTSIKKRDPDEEVENDEKPTVSSQEPPSKNKSKKTTKLKTALASKGQLGKEKIKKGVNKVKKRLLNKNDIKKLKEKLPSKNDIKKLKDRLPSKSDLQNVVKRTKSEAKEIKNVVKRKLSKKRIKLETDV